MAPPGDPPLAALALATPLLVGHGILLYPYVTPKVLFLRSVVLLLLAVWISAWLQGQVRLRRSLVGAAVLLSLLSFLVSSLAGIDLRRSFFDTPARMLSFFTLLCLAAYYAVLASTLRTWPDWRGMLRTLAVVSLPVFLGAIGQQVGLIPDEGTFGDRAASTAGNPVFLAGFASASSSSSCPWSPASAPGPGGGWRSLRRASPSSPSCSPGRAGRSSRFSRASA